MLEAEKIAEAVELLERRCGLDALYVFGSRARDEERPGSDVDLAALTRRVPGALEALELRGELEEKLGAPVDLVFLGEVSPILAWQVLRHGRLVHDACPRRRAEHEIRTLTDYADLKRARLPAERALVDRVKRAG